MSGPSGGRLRIAAGLSETSASLNDGGCGSGSDANTPLSRGAATGVPSPGGSSASRGPPTCGAKYVSQRKNGFARAARRWIASTARSVNTSVSYEAGSSPYFTILPFSFSL